MDTLQSRESCLENAAYSAMDSISYLLAFDDSLKGTDRDFLEEAYRLLRERVTGG